MENIMGHVMEGVPQSEIKEERKVMEVAAGGSLAEGVVGAGAIALAIIGLAGILALPMMAICAILIGAGLLFGGGSAATILSRIMKDTNAGRLGAVEVETGTAIETLGGISGIVLGILSLLGILPMILLPIAAIVFGGAFILGTGLTAHLNDLRIEKYCDSKESRHVAREMVKVSEGIQAFIGLDSLILGILALVGLVPVTLTLVAMLALGFAALTVGSMVTGRMVSAFHCA